MRGTRGYVRGHCGVWGIIPAHAGNTADVSSVRCSDRDHPRACGEHSMALPLVNGSTGSSPRMRGTRIPLPTFATEIGIIPAHAGNTSKRLSGGTSGRDHPRACGEHFALPAALFALLGSSPRMRGTHDACGRARSNRGIIPAHAGNTLPPSHCKPNSGDHPRACGEHTSRLAQYRGFLIRSVCFLFSFILSTSLLAGIYWRCSIRDEEHRQKTLPSHWMAV